MIGSFLCFFEKIKSFKSGYVVFILNKAEIKLLCIGLEKEGVFSLSLFTEFSKKEISSLENLFFYFKKNFSLKVKKITALSESWQVFVKYFANEESEFKVFKIEDLK